jgi:hypothetical protein
MTHTSRLPWEPFVAWFWPIVAFGSLLMTWCGTPAKFSDTERILIICFSSFVGVGLCLQGMRRAPGDFAIALSGAIMLYVPLCCGALLWTIIHLHLFE